MVEKPDTKEIKVSDLHAWYNRPTSDWLLIITAVGGIVISIVSLYTQQKVDAVQEQTTISAEKANEKLNVIHTQTNSNLTGVNKRLDAAYEKIETLEKLLLKKAEEKNPNEEKEP